LARRATNALEKERQKERQKERRAFGYVRKHIHTGTHQYSIGLIFLFFFSSRVCSLPQRAILPLKKRETTNRKEEEEKVEKRIHLITGIANK